MRFLLFVEGHTEKKALPSFLKRWLDPRVPQPVGIACVRFEGWAEFTKNVKKKVYWHLNGPNSNDIIGIIGLLDLYGPTFYPSHLSTAEARFSWAKEELEREVGHARFRQFFSVHEVEAWLLSQPALFPLEVRNAFPGRVSHPETVNFNSPPAKLLEELYKVRLKQTYKKITNGKELFDNLDPELAYSKCPKLKQLLDEMLAMATS